MSETAPATGSPLRAGPLPFRERRRLQPTRAALVTLGVAVAVLPPAHRERYTLELLAELHDVPRQGQLRHSLGFLAHAWDLRSALDKTRPEAKGARAMRRSLRCMLHVHHYVTRRNGEVQPPDIYRQCTRCGNIRDFPLWPTWAGA